jgi:hypothetical protein
LYGSKMPYFYNYRALLSSDLNEINRYSTMSNSHC